MLTNLRIENFKSWRDTGPIRLAPITVFFGANSAGKTSILQFLLMLKQTSDSPDRGRILRFGDDYSLVDLGTFPDLIFEHDLANRLKFEFCWSLPVPLVFSNPLTEKSYRLDQISFNASIASEVDKQHVKHLQYRGFAAGDESISVELVAALADGSRPNEYRIAANGYDLSPTPGRVSPLPPPSRFYGFPDEVAAYYQNAAFSSDLALALERQLKRIFHLGPLRDTSRRSYAWAGDVPEHVSSDGDDAISALLSAADRRISGGLHESEEPFQDVTAKWLKQLGLLDYFAARKIAPNRKEYEVRVRTRGSGTEVDLTDVGFGISQVLPVVIESFYVQPHSTVMIEHPELHLHPRAQSELADLFIAAVQAREKSEDRGIQFIVESHSEHFLQRLQRRVAEKILSPDDVALYFCEPGSRGSVLRELKVNQFGEIEDWPNDFFGDPMTDIAARMNAAAETEAELSHP